VSIKSSPEMDMPNRARTFSPAIFATLFAGIALTAGMNGAAQAADDCLAAPKAQTPQGTHWYYRVERTTKRHCWYTRAESPALAQASPAADDAVPPPSSATLQPAIANARAELPPTTAPVDRRALSLQPSSATISNAAPANTTSAAPQGQDQQRWSLASRWSDQASADDTADAAPAADAADARQRLQSAAMKRPVETPVTSLWTLVGALVSALALAGLVTAAIMTFGKSRRQNEMPDRRSANWGSDAKAPTASVETLRDQPPPMNWIRIAREMQEAHHRSNEVEELLARAPRRPAV
jgi:hypothetical protein